MYADDLVLMSQIKEGLQKCLDRLYEYCQKRKLVVNTDKTKIMIFNKSEKMLKNCRFIYNSDIIEMVQEFKYLGIRIRASVVFTRGVADLSNKAESHVHAKTKIQIHTYIPNYIFGFSMHASNR